MVVTGMLERRIVSHSSRISISLGRMSSFTGWHGSDYPVQCLRMGITYRVRVVIPGAGWARTDERGHRGQNSRLAGCEDVICTCRGAGQAGGHKTA